MHLRMSPSVVRPRARAALLRALELQRRLPRTGELHRRVTDAADTLRDWLNDQDQLQQLGMPFLLFVPLAVFSAMGVVFGIKFGLSAAKEGEQAARDIAGTASTVTRVLLWGGAAWLALKVFKGKKGAKASSKRKHKLRAVAA